MCAENGEQVRNNAVTLTDPTGLDVTFKCDTKENCTKARDDFNNRKNAQFKVELGKDGKLQVVKGSVTKDLKSNSAEGKLLAAINDTENHATINVVGNTGTPFFGTHASEGVNTVDMQNLAKLDAAGNAGGLNSGDTLAHEAMDAYYSLTMDSPLEADLEAAGLFPGLEPPTSMNADKNSTNLLGLTAVQPITNGSGSESITMRYVTPIPLADLQGKTPQQVVQMSGGARVEGVTFVKPPKQ